MKCAMIDLEILADQLEFAVLHRYGRTTITATDISVLQSSARKLRDAEAEIRRMNKKIHTLMKQRAELQQQIDPIGQDDPITFKG